MSTLYIANAFSLQMIEFPEIVQSKVSVHYAQHLIKICNTKSVVGHEDTAKLLSVMLEDPIEYNRESILMGEEDAVLVAQVIGGRLPPGATELPAGARMEFRLVTNRVTFWAGNEAWSLILKFQGDHGTVKKVSSLSRLVSPERKHNPCGGGVAGNMLFQRAATQIVDGKRPSILQ